MTKFVPMNVYLVESGTYGVSNWLLQVLLVNLLTLIPLDTVVVGAVVVAAADVHKVVSCWTTGNI